jgi:hypothetical protein
MPPTACPRCGHSAGCLALPGGWVACRSAGDVAGWQLVKAGMYRPVPATAAATIADAAPVTLPAVAQPSEPSSPPPVAPGPAGEVSASGAIDTRALARLRAWIARHGNRATPRQLQRAYPKRFPTRQVAQAALDALAASGSGMWQTVIVGRKISVFSLTPEVRPADAACAADGAAADGASTEANR